MKVFGRSDRGISSRHIHIVSERTSANRRVQPGDVQFLRDSGAPGGLIKSAEGMVSTDLDGAAQPGDTSSQQERRLPG